MGREQSYKDEKQALMGQIEMLSRELEAARNVRKTHNNEREQIMEKVRQAERQSNKWHLKYCQLKTDMKETKDVIKLYENLLDKLTE